MTVERCPVNEDACLALADIVSLPDDRFAPIVLKNSKSNQVRNSRRGVKFAISAVDIHLKANRVYLTFVATLNAPLWLLALRGRGDPELLATAIFPVFVFLVGTGVACVAAPVAQFTWCLAFGAPLAGWLAARRWPLRTN
ncbi:hypothetical protein [Bradyrhizobium sp. th.b2]|uniref:hypothetical protein n=1 Tax=Bradyrhizobium sp. th-b2 TaxID=172088 RepID=UPI0012EB6BFF|nr:hypothetical protein [Bradyrhizobium sp. th.b2]